MIHYAHMLYLLVARGVGEWWDYVKSCRALEKQRRISK